MGDMWKALFLGVIEGVTEFFPISSTGHLILFGEAVQFPEHIAQHFHIAVQLGAIFAVVFLYKTDFLPLLHPKNWRKKLTVNLILVTLPAIIAGLLFYSTIKTLLFNPLGVAVALIIGAIVMIITEKYKKTTSPSQSLASITKKQAFLIGLSQCAALWPGMSRSAATIIGGVWVGLNRQLAAKFAFMAAVPVMAAAVSYDLLKNAEHLTSEMLVLIAIGMLSAFIVSMLSITVLLKLLQRFGFMPFAYYRIALGLLILGWHLQ